MSIRVLMLTNAITPDQLGGLQRYVRELSAALVARGAEVSIVTRQVHDEDPLREIGADGVDLRRYPVTSRDDRLYFLRYPLAAFGSAWRASRASTGGTIVHVHFSLPGMAAALSPGPYVQTFHAPAYKEIRAERQGRYELPAVGAAERALRAGERLLVRRAERIAVLSDFMRGEVETLDAGAAARVWSIPGGLDTDHFSPGPSSVAEAEAEGSGPLLFTARRFVPRTGVQELVRAMPAVLAAVPDARLAVAGDGPLRAGLQRDIDQAGLGDRVRLLGRVSDAALLSWYRRADLFVMPTQELEGFGLSAAEALACGTPVVGTPAGAVPELLAPLDPRLVAPGTSSEDLARGIIAALADPALLPSVASRARAHVHPAMSWRAVADRYLEFYEAGA